ncbi:unnamed protein product, partial [Ectocarpus sp. 12 AP-2014]
RTSVQQGLPSCSQLERTTLGDSFLPDSFLKGGRIDSGGPALRPY